MSSSTTMSAARAEDVENITRYAAHLTPENLEIAQRALVAKAIGEFSHERLLTPEADDEGYALTTPAGDVTYRFRANVHALNHWVVDPASITRTAGHTLVESGERSDPRIETSGADSSGLDTASASAPAYSTSVGASTDTAEHTPVESGERSDPRIETTGAGRVDAQVFIAEFAPTLGIPDSLLPTYLEEIASTLASSAWKIANSTATVDDLVNADYQQIESAMTEGHPGFVANNGRIGFGGDDYAAYAPEVGQELHLVWLAARRSLTHLACGDALDEKSFYESELGEETLTRFAAELVGLGLDPAEYVYLPAHPWQWTNKLAITFAPDIARRDLVCLGAGTDAYRPQQSIRTFFNVSDPNRHYVKVALSIQNMGFMRGLSPNYMRATPAINDWVYDIVRADETLQECGFDVLRERASIGYTGDAYHQVPGTSPYKKMIAGLWRESPMSRLAEGERLATMASLVHRDNDRKSLVAKMIEASGVEPIEWVSTYLRAHLRPLVHCLYRYDLAFMPHGENLIMVLRNNVPVRMLMKDIGEEIAVMGDYPLPEDAERARADVPPDVRALAIHTDVFDGFFRYLAAILDEDGVLPEAEFWAEVRRCIEEHRADHPELEEAAAAYHLTRPTFKHSCLNRLQLRNTLQMVDLTDQAESLIFAGTLDNPIAE